MDDDRPSKKKALVPVNNLPEKRYAYQGKVYQHEDNLADVGQRNATWDGYVDDEDDLVDYPVAQDRRRRTITEPMKQSGSRKDYYKDIVEFDGTPKNRIKVGTNKTPSMRSIGKRKPQSDDDDENIIDAAYQNVYESVPPRDPRNLKLTKNSTRMQAPTGTAKKDEPDAMRVISEEKERTKSQVFDIAAPKNKNEGSPLVSQSKRVNDDSLISAKLRRPRSDNDPVVDYIYDNTVGKVVSGAGKAASHASKIGEKGGNAVDSMLDTGAKVGKGIGAGIGAGLGAIDDLAGKFDKSNIGKNIRKQADADYGNFRRKERQFKGSILGTSNYPNNRGYSGYTGSSGRSLNREGIRRLEDLQTRMEYYYRHHIPHPTRGSYDDNEVNLQKKIDKLLRGEAGDSYYTKGGNGGRVVTRDSFFGGSGYGLSSSGKDFSALTTQYSTKDAGGSIMGTAKGGKDATGSIMGARGGKDAAGTIMGQAGQGNREVSYTNVPANRFVGNGKDASGSIIGGRKPTTGGLNLMKTNSNVVVESSDVGFGVGTKNAAGSIIGNKKTASVADLFSSNKPTVKATVPEISEELDPSMLETPVYVPAQERHFGRVNDTKEASRSGIYKRRSGGVRAETRPATKSKLTRKTANGKIAETREVTPSKINRRKTGKIGEDTAVVTPSKLARKKKQATPSKIIGKLGTSGKTISVGVLRRVGEIGTTGSENDIVSKPKIATPSRIVTQKRHGGTA